MKKIKHSILALLLCFVFLLTSCGGENKPQNNQSTPNSSAQTNQSVMQNGSANNTAATCQNGHKVVTDEAVAPTCTESGLTKGSHCSVCNEVIIKQETIKPNGHSMVADDKVDATCTQSGLTSGAHCVVCNEIMIAQKEIPQLEHNYTDWIVRNESTCTSFGVEYRTCNSCKKEETREIALNPHATMIWVTEKAATCTANGIKAKKCSACLTTFETQTIASPGHSWKDATCTEPRTCSSCKITQGSILEHKWVEETCVTPQFCPDCGKIGNSEKPHTFDNYECIVCGRQNIITATKYSDEEIFDAFSNSKIKIKFSNFKIDTLKVMDTTDNVVYSAGLTDEINVTLSEGSYIVSCTYYNSYETVMQNMRQPDGSYSYQYVTKGVGTQYSMLIGINVKDASDDSSAHTWYVKNYVPSTCTKTGQLAFGCATCSSILEKIVPLSHIDTNTDHSCDECQAVVELHSDKAGDGDHLCEYCKATASSCTDSDKNHICDECDTNVGTHSDKSNDGDHKCDYGCGEILTSCNDADKDHDCDDCGVNMGSHSDKKNDGNHLCEYCKKVIGNCTDSDKNHICDECGANVGNHSDESNDGDHKCDYGCGEILTSCKDTDKDHGCDDCGINMGTHADSENDGDHACDYCGENISQCVDANNDRNCDECSSRTGYSRNGNKITFGSYPQTEVTDSALTSTLTSMAGMLPSSSDSQAWTSYGYYICGNVSNFMWYIDVEHSGEKYRGVYFTSYKPYCVTSSSPVAAYAYQYNNGYHINTVYWFKYEPISWTILSEDTAKGTALILCDMIIDSQQYDYDGSYNNNYAESTIRKWLNDNFYNTAFNELQKQIILTTTVDNSAATTSLSTNEYACENTEDKIFLLSYEEVTNADYGFSSNYSLIKNATDYSKVQVPGTSEYRDTYDYWWLRSPYYYYSNRSSLVDETGTFGNVNISCDILVCYVGGVVPALQIRL